MNLETEETKADLTKRAETLEDKCNRLRAGLLCVEMATREMLVSGQTAGEASAQAMLAVRHLEDARMRLGKVIQHTAGGGVSCFDSGRPTQDGGR